MQTGTLEEVMQDMRNGTYDFTENGKCSQCGQCCSSLLPMTDKEIETIRRYIKRHGIKEQKHFIPLASRTIDLTCPFLDTSKKKEKCTIYEVRPAICRCFICSEPNGARNYKELFKCVRKAVDVRETFFGGVKSFANRSYRC